METEKQNLIALCTANLEHATSFINKYLALANLHNTNFIICKYWSQVPQVMKDSLKSLPADYMSGLLMKEEWPRQELPAESRNGIWQASSDPLPREMVDDKLQPPDPDLPLTWHHSDLNSFMSEAASYHMDKLSYPRRCKELYDRIFDCTSQRSVPFVKHSMGEKKSHEVELMAEACAQIAKCDDISQIVDLGSGKGYLATTLAMQYGYNVVGIDSQEGNTHGAMQRKQRLEKQYNGLVRREEEKAAMATYISRQDGASSNNRTKKQGKVSDVKEASSYTAVTAYIQPEDDLHQYIGDTIPTDSKCLLTGLHTCGNLAVSMAKLFLRTESCKAMINIGCCYHLVDEMFVSSPFDPKDLASPHFPMSSVLIQQGIKLGRNCRMLSMQAMEKSAMQGVGGGLEKSLYWRALLQQILLDIHGFWRKDWIVGKISSKCSDFVEYVSKALTKLKIDSKKVLRADIERYLEVYSECEKQMSMFFQLRTALSPCIESIILLDRCLYLLEQDNTNVVLVNRLFDPVQSPRCYAVIANKS